MIFSMALESANRGLIPMRGSSAGSRRRQFPTADPPRSRRAKKFVPDYTVRHTVDQRSKKSLTNP
jgi:hypothetical protein